MSKPQIRIFSGENVEELERQVNEFLGSKFIYDVQIQVDEGVYVFMVVYLDERRGFTQ